MVKRHIKRYYQAITKSIQLVLILFVFRIILTTHRETEQLNQHLIAFQFLRKTLLLLTQMRSSKRFAFSVSNRKQCFFSSFLMVHYFYLGTHEIIQTQSCE